MVWTIRDDTDKLILLELYNQTDRGAALIAASYLEDRLTDAIKSRLNSYKTLEGTLFKGVGPLASFSVKIDLGLLLGVFDTPVHERLHTIREIRNEFAHKAEPRDFNSQRIKAYCMRLDLNVQGEFNFKAPDGTESNITLDLKSDGTPKRAFLNTIKLLLLLLDMEIKIAPSRKPVPSVYSLLGITLPSTKKS